MSIRVNRVEKEVLQIVAQFLAKEYGGSSDLLITVSRVQLSSDLRSGRVFFSFFSTDDTLTETEVEEELQGLAPEVQQQISKQIRMKYNPRLEFVFDRSQEKILKVEKLLRDIETDTSENTPDKS